MKDVFSFLGFLLILFSVLGAITPGWHFHVAFANDETAYKWHKIHAEELAAVIEAKKDKEQKP